MNREQWILNLFAFCLVGTTTGVADACTVFTITTGQHALLANNEDFTKRGGISFIPGEQGRFARINVGFQTRWGRVETFAQGGMNEKGLAFDAMVVSEVEWHADPEKQPSANLADVALDSCATVAETIQLFHRCNCEYLATTQFMFADATGASAVIAWDPEFGLTITESTGGFQIATNTRIANSGYRCSRAMRVQQILTGAESLDVEAARSALAASHQYGPYAFTSYSCIYDLRAKRVFIYNLTNFDEVVRVDMSQELATGYSRRPFSELFHESPTVAEIRKREQRSEFDTRIQLAPSELKKFAGTYAPDPAPQVRVRIESTGKFLLVRNPGQPPATLYPETENIFRIAPDRGQVTFHRSDSGAVTGLTLHKHRDVTASRTND